VFFIADYDEVFDIFHKIYSLIIFEA